jgi:transposase
MNTTCRVASPDAGGAAPLTRWLHIVLLSAAGCNPTDIAGILFCSSSSVYRIVRAYREGTLSWEHDEQGAAPETAAVADGPAQGKASGGVAVSAETMRRWLHDFGWVWKHPQLVAKAECRRKWRCG